MVIFFLVIFTYRTWPWQPWGCCCSRAGRGERGLGLRQQPADRRRQSAVDAGRVEPVGLHDRAGLSGGLPCQSSACCSFTGQGLGRGSAVAWGTVGPDAVQVIPTDDSAQSQSGRKRRTPAMVLLTGKEEDGLGKRSNDGGFGK